MAMIFHSREALAENEGNQLGIEALGLSQDSAIYYAQALEGLKKGIPLRRQHVSQDDRGYSCYVMGGPVDYKQAYEDTKEIFSEIQSVLLKNDHVRKDWSDLYDYRGHHPQYEGALKHYNGAKETKEILTECAEATGLQPEQFMNQAFINACRAHSGSEPLPPTSDKKFNQAVDLFVKRSFEVPTLSDNVYYGIQNQAGDAYKTMNDIESGIKEAQESMKYHADRTPRDFSNCSKTDLQKIDRAFDVYMMFKHEVEAIRENSWYKEQRKEDIRSLAQERVGVKGGELVEDGIDRLADREKNNRTMTEERKISEMKNALDNRLVR